MTLFSLRAQVLGVERHARATADGVGITVETIDGVRAAHSLNDAIRLAREHFGPFLAGADRHGHGAWGLIVEVAEAAAVYGNWPLVPQPGGPAPAAETLVGRIRSRWKNGSARSALENAIEIIRAYTDGRRRAA